MFITIDVMKSCTIRNQLPVFLRSSFPFPFLGIIELQIDLCFQKCYGSSDLSDIEAVINVYKDLKLPKIYKAYEEETYKDIDLHIKQLQGAGQLLPPKLFLTFLDRIYKRSQ